jgi:hypothetical protein
LGKRREKTTKGQRVSGVPLCAPCPTDFSEGGRFSFIRQCFGTKKGGKKNENENNKDFGNFTYHCGNFLLPNVLRR